MPILDRSNTEVTHERNDRWSPPPPRTLLIILLLLFACSSGNQSERREQRAYRMRGCGRGGLHKGGNEITTRWNQKWKEKCVEQQAEENEKLHGNGKLAEDFQTSFTRHNTTENTDPNEYLKVNSMKCRTSNSSTPFRWRSHCRRRFPGRLQPRRSERALPGCLCQGFSLGPKQTPFCNSNRCHVP